MEKKFQRTREDFQCLFCGAEVKGTGYTNHCPYCLWSQHVDVYPGDRQAACGGLMEPIGVDQKHGEFYIIHQCQACGHTKPNKVAPEDNAELITQLASRPVIQ